MKSMNGRTLLTLKEVAGYLRISETTLYNLARRGEIPAVKVVNKWRFRKEDIDYWLEKQTNKSTR